MNTKAESIAPVWHTVAVLLLIAALAASSLLLRQSGGDAKTSHQIFGYVFTATAEWLITAFIWFGCKSRGNSLRTLLGDTTATIRAILRDIGLAIAFLALSNVILSILGHLVGATANEGLRNLLPRTNSEVAAYLLLAPTAGICEELIFRGYLQPQFTAWTNNVTAGILIQGIAFGVGHAYQGPKMMMVISVYGCLFGLLANWRRSLRPGMIAHFLQDGIGGLLLARYALK